MYALHNNNNVIFFFNIYIIKNNFYVKKTQIKNITFNFNFMLKRLK